MNDRQIAYLIMCRIECQQALRKIKKCLSHEDATRVQRIGWRVAQARKRKQPILRYWQEVEQ